MKKPLVAHWQRKKKTWSAWRVVLVGDVCLFFGLHNLQPEALSLGVPRCWFLVPVACPSYLIHTQVLKSPYPSAQTLLICSITLNATAREYLPPGTLRGSGKHCSPETTLGPEPCTASWTLTRASISGKDLPGEEGTDMKENEEKEEGGRGGRQRLQRLQMWSTCHHHYVPCQPVLGFKRSS